MSVRQPSHGPERAWSAAVTIGLILGLVIVVGAVIWAILAT